MQRYFFLNSDYRIYAYPQIAELFGPQRDKEIMVGNAILIYVFHNSMENYERAIKNHFRMSEKYDIPIIIEFDPFTFWTDVPELWNWWDPERPGYDPANRENVEWYDWGSENAVKIGWFNWGRQFRTLPMANVFAPRYQEAVRERMAMFMTWVKEWVESLPQDRKYLFGGVKMTGELNFGVNNYYYEGGNELYDQPHENDPHADLDLSDLPGRGMVATGYAALAYSGIRTEGTITADDIFALEKEFAGFMGRLALGYGIPRNMIYSHAAGVDGDLASSIQSMTCPSWSFYHQDAIDPANTPQVTKYLPMSDAPEWAISEWNFFNESQEIWEEALRNCYSLPGCRFVTVFNYDSVFTLDRRGVITEKPGAVAALRKLQDGSLFQEGE